MQGLETAESLEKIVHRNHSLPKGPSARNPVVRLLAGRTPITGIVLGLRIAEGVIRPLPRKPGRPLDKEGVIREVFSGEGTAGGTAGKPLVLGEKKYSVRLKSLTVTVLKKLTNRKLQSIYSQVLPICPVRGITARQTDQGGIPYRRLQSD